eukprot:1142996-Pelagomonas_calceolata.AAC.2
MISLLEREKACTRRKPAAGSCACLAKKRQQNKKLSLRDKSAHVSSHSSKALYNKLQQETWESQENYTFKQVFPNLHATEHGYEQSKWICMSHKNIPLNQATLSSSFFASDHSPDLEC